MNYVNISGMRFNDNRKRIHKNVSVTEEEREALKTLMNDGVEIYAQTTTRDDKVDVGKLL